MDIKNSDHRDVFIVDLENGRKEVTREQARGGTNAVSGRDNAPRTLDRVWSGLIGINDLDKGGGALTLENCVSVSIEIPRSRVEDLAENVDLLENNLCADKLKKKSCKKPPRPPRHLKASSLDMADQKLMQELSELAALKRARMERMKKRIKNAKLASSNNNSNLFAMIVTVLFCLVIVWQGVFSHGSSSITFHGSPEASVQTPKGLISIQFHKNVSQIAPELPPSAPPNNVAAIPALMR